MPNMITVIALQILGFLVIYIILKRWMGRRIKEDESGEKIQDELTSIMVELNRTTEQNIQLIEDKIGALQELLAEVDKKLSVLKRESEKHEISRSIYDRIKQAQESGEGTQIRDRNVQKEVIKLHREGFSPSIIAAQVGTTVGEVELIISLDRSRD
jgi:hypothetical protein